MTAEAMSPCRRRNHPSRLGARLPLDQRAGDPGDDRLRLADLQRLAAVPLHILQAITLGGWLGGALLWHFAAMWVLVINGIVYVTLGLATGRFRRKLLPIYPSEVIADAKAALTFKLAHDDLSHYNAVQKLLYTGVILCRHRDRAVGPVDLEAGAVPGTDRAVRRLRRRPLRAFLRHGGDRRLSLVVHVALALIVPKSLRAMVTGR